MAHLLITHVRHTYLQELCRVLFTAMAKFGVGLESKLFEGNLTSTLRCLRCGRRSTREEAFCDVALDVGNCSTLEEALHEFTAWETLDGDNCWHCDACDAKVCACTQAAPFPCISP